MKGFARREDGTFSNIQQPHDIAFGYGGEMYAATGCGGSIHVLGTDGTEKTAVPSRGLVRIAVHGDTLYSAELGSGRVHRFSTRTGELISTFGFGWVSNPYAICCRRRDGKVFVANHVEHRVQVFESDGTAVGTIELADHFPTGLAVDRYDKLHVCCQNSVQLVDADTHTAGIGYATGIEAYKVAVDSDGYSVLASGNFLTVFGPSRDLLYYITGFNYPRCLAVSPEGALYVAVKEVVKLPLLHPPFRLSSLCIHSILLHLDQLPVENLPPTLTPIFADWVQEVTVELMEKERSCVIRLKLKTGIPLEIVRNIVRHRLLARDGAFQLFVSTLAGWKPLARFALLKRSFTHLRAKTFL